MTAETQRWTHALRRVASLERRSRVLTRRPDEREFTCLTHKAWSGEAGRAVLAWHRGDVGPTVTLQAPVQSAAVLIGKFDVEQEIRLRAFYPELSLCARFQAGGRRSGIPRTVHAWRTISPHDPTLMPALVDHGRMRLGKMAYLVEELREGRRARAPELVDLAGPLVTRLHRVHQAVGVESRQLSTLTHHELRSRWDDFATTHDTDPALTASVGRLLARDALLQVSIGHGDLVSTNMLVHDSEVVLLDWEYAGSMPIAFDLAKLQVLNPELDAAQLQQWLPSWVEKPDHYTFAEQLALAHVQVLTWHRSRQERATRAGRESWLASGTQRRLELIAALLS